MNELIESLTKQATTIEYGVDNGFDRVVFDKEKFAELIVRECIKQAKSEEDRFYGIGAGDLALTMEHFQEVLKKHFGVE